MNFSPQELPTDAQPVLIRGVQEKLAAIMTSPLNAHYEDIQKLHFQDARMEIRDGVVGFDGHYEEQSGAADAARIANDLIPWRKGPFRVNGLTIDAEWRSDKKWDRLLRDLPALAGKTVADVGCNNGYYLFRIAEAGARRVLGFDPTLKYWLQFQFITRHAPELPIGFLPLGWQALRHLPGYFDVIFLMGVNYHDPNPLEIFHACKTALKPGGTLICESVTVPSPAHLEIFPAGKYAGIGGVYAMPTVAALSEQLRFSGFADVRLLHEIKLTADEQRRSEFSPQKSFADAITADGTSIEGQRKDALRGGAGSGASVRLSYPPIHRGAISAVKP